MFSASVVLGVVPGALSFGGLIVGIVVGLTGMAGRIRGGDDVGWFGARMDHRVPERLLKPIIVTVLTASGLKLLRVI